MNGSSTPAPPGSTLAPAGVARLAAPPRPSAPAPYVPGYDGPEDFPTMWRMAESLALASILPRHFHDNPGNVFAVMTQARAANLPVFVALQHMNVIDGRVEESAELVRGMLIRAGYEVDLTETTDTRAALVLTPPGRRPITVSFTLVEAQQMGLADKRNWKLNPKAMLVARVTTRAASWHAPQVTLGLANLSHGDLGEDVPEALAHLREPDPDVESAAEVLASAARASTAADVAAIGQAARKAGLLEVALDGRSLQAHLMDRIEALRHAAPAALAADEEEVPEVLPCGCPTEGVLADGAHRPGCGAGA